MDKQIPIKEQRKRKFISFAKVATVMALIAGAIAGYANLQRPSVKLNQLRFATADVGTIESTISTSGVVKPSIEEEILSPIATRIVEVYKTIGDSVEAGEALMRLNLSQLDNELQTLYEQRASKLETLRQERIRNENDLQNREMDIESKRLSLEQLRQDLRNEEFLDSLGSGTGENVRRAQASLRSAEVELKKLERDLINQRDFQAANMRIKQTEMEQFERKIRERETVKRDACILSPRKAVLTRIKSKVGQTVGANEEVAVIADLSHFIIEGELADTYQGQIGVGAEVIIKLGKATTTGHIVELSPVSQGSKLPFVVNPDSKGTSILKPGTRAEIHIKAGVITDAVRIPNGIYYTSGPGTYELFVLTADGNEVEKRLVNLGKANYDYVEVIKGIEPGEQIVLSDMSRFKNKRSVKLEK
ncbi:MAG: efflux RND transporter periplasmic adaptor subunit [Muribaculaceae bacterium]|nr:efflux RND transporter periplasmic adaptor subunit [Muribaculaceae bacterium]